MMEKKKITARPPTAVKKDQEMTFITEGIIDTQITAPTRPKYPWEETNVREDVMKVFNLRLSEPYFLKLKYISETTGKSYNSICISLIESFIDKEISE